MFECIHVRGNWNVVEYSHVVLFCVLGCEVLKGACSPFKTFGVSRLIVDSRGFILRKECFPLVSPIGRKDIGVVYLDIEAQSRAVYIFCLIKGCHLDKNVGLSFFFAFQILAILSLCNDIGNFATISRSRLSPRRPATILIVMNVYKLL